MINRNLIIDYNKKIKIPQNDWDEIVIIKPNDWRYSIDIIIKIEKKINYLNLFITLKSYILNTDYIFKNIAIRIKKKKDDYKNPIITENVNNIIFSKISYSDFIKWVENRILIDQKYYDDGDFYCFTLSAIPELVSKIDLNYLKPDFPWKEEIITSIRLLELKEVINDELIKNKNRMIKELEKKNKKIILLTNAKIKILYYYFRTPILLNRKMNMRFNRKRTRKK